MESLFWIGFVGAAMAGIYALIQAKKVMSFSEGTERMQQIAGAIREGANAYLQRQYKTVLPVFAAVFVILMAIAFASGGDMLSKFTPFAFLTGGVWSLLAGFIGMKIATHANSRTAQAASEGLNRGLRVAFSAGSVMGFTVVALGILDVTLWFFLLRYGFGIQDPVQIGNIMVMNGMGASFMALFARVGGGIYTKAADVGADLVGKVEKKIPEDDPRNPATIADNVGDNVGDVAGMGADLYESYVGSILATFALSAIGGYGFSGMLLPLLLAVSGILCSVIGSQLVRVREDANHPRCWPCPSRTSSSRTWRASGGAAFTSPSSAAWSPAASSVSSRSISPPSPIGPPGIWPPPPRRATPPSSSAASHWAWNPR